MNGIRYRAGYKYQLAEPYSCQTPFRPAAGISTNHLVIDPNGVLFIKDGYAWDGPSGPAIDTRNFMRGSLVHDALYQLIRLGHLSAEAKAAADELLRQMCVEDGMSAVRAWWVYTAVKTFAARAVRPSSEPQVLSAP